MGLLFIPWVLLGLLLVRPINREKPKASGKPKTRV